MRVLLLGAGGMLARDLVAQRPSDMELVTRTRAELDVTDEASVAAATAEAPFDVIINCAAYNMVDRAETEREQAFLVNGDAPGIIGRGSIRTGQSAIPNPLVVHFSTDYVFDGRSNRPYREEDPTNPIGVYGASKLAGEQALLESGARCLIIRTSWLFGLHGPSFPRTMWQRATEGKATRVVNDQRGRPTYAVDLARAVWGLLGKGEAGRGKGPGMLHVANTGGANWYEIARYIFAATGASDLISPCTTAEYPTPAKRPGYSVLDTSRYDSLSGCPLPRWEDALARFLAELQDA